MWGDKAHSAIFDNSKIKMHVPGFEATISYAVGIKKAIDWFEEDPKRQTINQTTKELIDRIIADYKNI